MGTTGSPDGALMVQWFFGGLVVLFYAVHRFNEPRQDPRPARSTTTFWRYWSACGGYVAGRTGSSVPTNERPGTQNFAG